VISRALSARPKCASWPNPKRTWRRLPFVNWRFRPAFPPDQPFWSASLFWGKRVCQPIVLFGVGEQKGSSQGKPQTLNSTVNSREGSTSKTRWDGIPSDATVTPDATHSSSVRTARSIPRRPKNTEWQRSAELFVNHGRSKFGCMQQANRKNLFIAVRPFLFFASESECAMESCPRT
jgi:hypothetical protein